jgi:lycopene cyclase domain-containing protein
MTYTALAAVAVLCSIVLDLLVLRTGMLARKAFWTAYAILFAFQLLVNGLLTGIPIVRYSQSAIIGLRVCWAPVEDVAFGFALIVTTLSAWVAAGRSDCGGAPRPRVRIRRYLRRAASGVKPGHGG